MDPSTNPPEHDPARKVMVFDNANRAGVVGGVLLLVLALIALVAILSAVL